MLKDKITILANILTPTILSFVTGVFAGAFTRFGANLLSSFRRFAANSLFLFLGAIRIGKTGHLKLDRNKLDCNCKQIITCRLLLWFTVVCRSAKLSRFAVLSAGNLLASFCTSSNNFLANCPNFAVLTIRIVKTFNLKI